MEPRFRLEASAFLIAMVLGTLALMRLLERLQLLLFLEEQDTSVLWTLNSVVRDHYFEVNLWLFLVDHPAAQELMESQARDGVREPLAYEVGEVVRASRRAAQR